jgi:hypothetical protein
MFLNFVITAIIGTNGRKVLDKWLLEMEMFRIEGVGLVSNRQRIFGTEYSYV